MLEIIIDTREQSPWAFDPACASTEIGTLRTGDYALRGDGNFAIERKSLDDFLGTISSGWERFQREIARMDGWVAKVIIVEGDYALCTFAEMPDGTVIPPAHRHIYLSPQFVEKRIAELTIMGASVLFTRDPHLAAGLAVAIFRQREKQINQTNNERTNQNRNSTDPELQAGRTR